MVEIRMIYISQLHGPRSNATGFIDPETFSSCFLVTVSQGSSSKVPLSAKLPEDPFEGPAPLPHPFLTPAGATVLVRSSPPPPHPPTVDPNQNVWQPLRSCQFRMELAIGF